MKPHKSLKKLLEVLNESQESFSAMIGAPRQRVADLVYGRGAGIRPEEIRLIAAATGADISNRNRLNFCVPKVKSKNLSRYSRQYFEDWRKIYGSYHPAAAERRVELGADHLRLILSAASSAGKAEAIWGAFAQWCSQTGESFKLLPALEEQLSKRAWKEDTGHYRFKTLQVSEPVIDEPGKRTFTVIDNERPFIKDGEREFVPQWRPGSDMRVNSPLRRMGAKEQKKNVKPMSAAG
jgi:hypothetical protein